MTARFARVSVTVALALAAVGTVLSLPSKAQAHPELSQGKWCELKGPWHIIFFPGQQTGSLWQGTWQGHLHHSGRQHSGVWVLQMVNQVQGTLTMYENNQLLCTAQVHLGFRHLTYGGARYVRR